MKAIFVLALLGVAVSGAAKAAPSGQDVARVTEQIATTLDGVIAPCPSTWQNAGSAQKRCVRADTSPDATRRALTRAAVLNLYGAWRSQNNTNYLYNWARTPAGFVSILVAPSAPGSATSLLMIDVPRSAVERTPEERPSERPADKATERPATPAAPAVTPPAATVTVRPAPTPVPAASGAPGFRRVLRLSSPRLNGEDVRAVQNRLIVLAGAARGVGDGWFGPVTAATVSAFQEANGLPVTGAVDRPTWDLLFSGRARPYDPSDVEARLRGEQN